jgi:uncharacterized protein YeaO (DUF488 family)
VIGLWLKEIAPSDELRKWFSHEPKKWIEFEERYVVELQKKKDFIEQIKKAEKEHEVITLLYAAKDVEHNITQSLVKLITRIDLNL